MFDSKDILARLQAGERIEDIAQSAADALNSAKAEYDKIEAEKKAAAAKAEAKKKALQKKKEQSMSGIMTGIIDYMNQFYPAFFDAADLAEFHRSFDPSTIVEAFDQAMEELKNIPAVAAELKKGAPKTTVKLSGEDAKQAEDVFNKFFEENNIF